MARKQLDLMLTSSLTSSCVATSLNEAEVNAEDYQTVSAVAENLANLPATKSTSDAPLNIQLMNKQEHLSDEIDN